MDLVVCATSTAPESMPSVACLVGEAIGRRGRGRDGPGGSLRRVLLRGLRRRLDARRRSGEPGAPDRGRRHEHDSGSRATAPPPSSSATAQARYCSTAATGVRLRGPHPRGRRPDGPLGRAGHPGDEHKLYQNGREVFKFAVRILPEMVEKLLSRNRISLDDVQYIIPHQANARIIQAAARKMEVPDEKIVVNLDRFGNTSAASIPLSYPDIYRQSGAGEVRDHGGLRLRADVGGEPVQDLRDGRGGDSAGHCVPWAGERRR